MKHAKQIKIGIILLILIGWSSSMRSQSYVGATIAGHLPLSLDKSDHTHLKASYGGDVGFVYEWHANSFFLQTGLNYSIDCPTVRVEDQDIEQAMIDTRNVPFIYRGMLRNRLDKIVAGQLVLPFYVGGEWHGFYVMAGAKAILNLHTRSQQRAELTSAGDYQDRYYEWLENMPNHGYYSNMMVQSNKPISLRLFNVRVGAEVGYSINLSSYNTRSTKIRIGAFVEYNIMEIMDASNTSLPSLQPDYTQYMSVDMTHIYSSAEGTNAKPHMLVCGARITVLFPVSKSGRDGARKYPCRCYMY